MSAEYPMDFHVRAARYRELAVLEQNDARATVLFEIANLFERMALDFDEHFLSRSLDKS